MHRISIALALSTLSFVSICSAQETATSAGSPADTTKLGGGTDTVVNCVGAQNGRIPIFTTSAPPNITICNSGIYEAAPYGTGAIGILNPNPMAALDVNGDISATTYKIAENTVLSTAGPLNSFNVAVGLSAGPAITSGTFNSFFGSFAGYASTTGCCNIFLGAEAGMNNTTGGSDIYIGNLGPASGTESNTIRIGVQGQGNSTQNAAYIAGIFGKTSPSGVPVFIDIDGQLGTQTSSLRFKEQVRDMGDITNALMKLRPVTFLYKPEYDKGERTLQYGLIAEEVAMVYPELVVNDADGKPYALRYQYLTTMVLNEAQKQYRRAESLAEVIKVQEQKISELEQRLTRLERLVPQTVAQK